VATPELTVPLSQVGDSMRLHLPSGSSRSEPDCRWRWTQPPKILEALSLPLDRQFILRWPDHPEPLSAQDLQDRATVSSRLASEYFRWSYHGRGSTDGPGSPGDLQFLGLLRSAYPIWRDDPVLGPYLLEWAASVLAEEPEALVAMLGTRPPDASAAQWAVSLACNLEAAPPPEWVQFVAEHLPDTEAELQVEVAFWSWHHQDRAGVLRSLPLGLAALRADTTCADRSTPPEPDGWIAVSRQDNCNLYRYSVDALLFELEAADLVALTPDWRVSVGRAVRSCGPAPPCSCFLAAEVSDGAWTIDSDHACPPSLTACVERALRSAIPVAGEVELTVSPGAPRCVRGTLPPTPP